MKEKGKKKGFTFNKMCLLLGLVPMLTLGLFLSGLALLMVSTNIKEGVESSLQIAASNVAQYFEYDIVNNGDVDYEEYSDHVFMESQQGHDVELTLYRGNVRFLTSIRNTDGSYSEGSLMPDDVWAYLSKGDDYYVENFPIYGENYFAYYVPIFDEEGNMWGAAFAGKHVEKYQDRLKTSVRNLVMIAGVMTVIFICVVLFVASLLSKIVSKVENSLNELSAGDLNADFSYVAKVTEFKHLVDCGRNLEDKLKDIIGSAKETAGILNDTASDVDNLSKNSADGADQISEAVIELSTTAQSMAETVQDANSSIIEMGDIIDVITDSVTTMVDHAKETSEATDKAVSAMAVLEKASERSTESIDSIRSQIKETYDAVDEIRTAADTIASISSETNLLALNASIEAARAGEAGKGFAVVAENIKKLAEESNQSAGQIQDIINHIISVSEKSVHMADEVGAILEEQKKALDDAYNQMDESKESNLKLGEGVNKVGSQAEALTGIKDAVLTNISDLSAISQENAASSEEVNASVENISDAIKNTRDEASVLSELSDTLIEKMSFFK